MALTAVLRPVDIGQFDRDAHVRCGSLTGHHRAYNVTKLPSSEQLKTVFEYLRTATRKHAVLQQLKQGVHTLKPISRGASGENFPKIPTLEIPEIYTICDIVYTKYTAFEGEMFTADMHSLEQNNRETEIALAKKVEDLREAIAKEKESVSWGIAVKSFSLIGAMLSVLAGIVMAATGVGAAGGALLIVGGILHLAAQIMEITGGWKHILQTLPGDDPTQKSAVLTWIQVSITVLSLVLAGAGAVIGGISAIKESMGWAQAMIGAIALTGTGIALIGKGIKDKQWKDKHADLTRDQITLDKLKYNKQSLMESVELISSVMEKASELRAALIKYKEQLNQNHARGA